MGAIGKTTAKGAVNKLGTSRQSLHGDERSKTISPADCPETQASDNTSHIYIYVCIYSVNERFYIYMSFMSKTADCTI